MFNPEFLDSLTVASTRSLDVLLELLDTADRDATRASAALGILRLAERVFARIDARSATPVPRTRKPRSAPAATPASPPPRIQPDSICGDATDDLRPPRAEHPDAPEVWNAPSRTVNSDNTPRAASTPTHPRPPLSPPAAPKGAAGHTGCMLASASRLTFSPSGP